VVLWLALFDGDIPFDRGRYDDELHTWRSHNELAKDLLYALITENDDVRIEELIDDAEREVRSRG
jgi:hypothetical protein